MIRAADYDDHGNLRSWQPPEPPKRAPDQTAEAAPHQAILQRCSMNDLDLAVAKARGFDRLNDYKWRPSTNWSQGGQIIERERINVCCNQDDRGAPLSDGEAWFADCNDHQATGPTPLIAAMRAYVASKAK